MGKSEILAVAWDRVDIFDGSFNERGNDGADWD
jgi:hypothetical protein